MPKRMKRPYIGTCRQCGNKFQAARSSAKYCSDACKRDHAKGDAPVQRRRRRRAVATETARLKHGRSVIDVTVRSLPETRMRRTWLLNPAERVRVAALQVYWLGRNPNVTDELYELAWDVVHELRVTNWADLTLQG